MRNFLITLIIAFTTLLSCSKHESTNELKADEKNLISLTQIKSYLDIGNEQLTYPENKNSLPIAQCSDISVNVNGMIYILDKSTYQLVGITPNGSIRYQQLAQGDGPMEFKSPGRISTDSDGNIYVSDDVLLKVVGFDSELQFINSYPIKYRVSDFVVSENSIYTLSFGIFRLDATGIIDRYRLAEPNSVAYPIGNSSLLDQDRIRAMAGNTDRVFLMDDKLVLMRWYPYQITWYTHIGDSVRSYNRDIDWFQEPARSSSGLVDIKSGLQTVGRWCPSECYTVVRYYRIKEGDRTSFWDLHSDFQNDPITFEENYFIEGQPKHIIFNGAEVVATYSEPQPHLIVYVMEF